MHRGRNGHGRRRGRRAADAGAGFTAVFVAASFLLAVIVGAGENGAGGSGAAVAFSPVTQWQVILAFAVMSAGLLRIMNEMRLRDARGPVFVGRVVDAAAAVLWNGGGPERLLPVLIVLVCSVLQAWFDFF